MIESNKTVKKDVNKTEIQNCFQGNKQKTLEYLYIINKHAKKYKRLGTENYRKGKKTTAKANSLKKEALYKIKEQVLQQIFTEADTIKLHWINDNKFYLFEFGKFSFHCPIETLDIPETYIEDEETLENFKSTEEKELANYSLKDCLLFFSEKYNINANEQLNLKYLKYGSQQYFIGWKYL